MKLYLTVEDVPNMTFLDPKMFLDAGHTFVDSAHVVDADIVINLNNHFINGSNVVMLSLEPAFHPHVVDCYTKNYLYHSVFRLGDCDASLGSFPITEDPIAYPYHPQWSGEDLRRPDTTMRSRRAFFAGLARFSDSPDAHGRHGLYAARTKLVSELPHCGVNVYAEGPGFGRDSRSDGRILDWDRIKLELCQKVQADFHLCLENCQMTNYISEKIHHGFASDLVVLYLGNKDIHKWVPSEAFINLNEYYNPERRVVNVSAVAEIIKTMTQEEYDRIIYSAREWRESARLVERFGAQGRRTTQKIIDRIAEVPVPCR